MYKHLFIASVLASLSCPSHAGIEDIEPYVSYTATSPVLHFTGEEGAQKLAKLYSEAAERTQDLKTQLYLATVGNYYAELANLIKENGEGKQIFAIQTKVGEIRSGERALKGVVLSLPKGWGKKTEEKFKKEEKERAAQTPPAPTPSRDEESSGAAAAAPKTTDRFRY